MIVGRMPDIFGLKRNFSQYFVATRNGSNSGAQVGAYTPPETVQFVIS